MSNQSWLISIRDAEKTCIVQDGKKKVHFKFQDGREMVEEYSLETNVIIRRAWRTCKKFASQPKWEIEVGDPDPVFAEEMDNIGITECSTAPFVTKRITKTSLEWRIRNLPYPVDMYKVEATPEENCITIRTQNKKFFKKIMLPDLQRLGLKPVQENIEFTHKFNTLIITYKKPPELLLSEKLILEEINKLKVSKEGDVQCKQS
ncbi:UNVERIFIED_CONTAM: hypothetical protein PYX00_007522 [Menopon gallinae]